MSDLSHQFIEQINTARSEGQQLDIVGFGSKGFLGRRPQGQRLELTGHSGIVDYQPIELVMTVRAGTSLGEIEHALAQHNQMLAFDPPHFSDQASIGGTLACNQSGPGRPWCGSVRDMVLGTRLINGKGELLRFGGQVMKNVAGFDASRLQAGAMGCFGVITEVSVKVLPKPDATITLMSEMSASLAITTMNELGRHAIPLTAACWIDGGLYLRFSGLQSVLNETVKQCISTLPSAAKPLDEADQFWRDLRDHRLEFFAGESPLWRFSLQSNADHFLPDQHWLIDWGGAQRWLKTDALLADTNIERMEQVAVDGNGQVSLFRGGDRSGEVFHNQTSALKTIHQRLKKSFDPEGLFNSGRLYSWL